jgi:peptide/nickel transport system substrate-binding protein
MRNGAHTALLCASICLALVGPANADTTFRIALIAAPPSKGNPLSTVGTTPQLFWTAIYDRLTDIDNDGNIVPQLAESWEAVSETEWHFHLRDDVVFSNGEPLTAETVKTGFDATREDAVNALTWFRTSTQFPRVDIIDEHTVAFHTEYPNAMAPAYLSSYFVVPSGVVKDKGIGGLINAPVGTGPFVVDSWEPDQVVLSRNPTSWRQPKVDAIEAKFVPDSSARLQALLTGQVDAAVAISPDQIGMLEAAGHRAVTRNPTRIIVFALKSTDPASPFSDVRVRKAFNFAVNKQVITEILLGGLVEPATQGATPFSVGYLEDFDPFPYDPDRARALLKEAGYEDGVSFVIESPSGTLPNDTAILQQITSDAARAGMNMEVQLITYPQLLRRTLLGELGGDGFLMDFTNRYADALRGVLDTNHTCNGPGTPWFCDREIQSMIDTASRTFNMEERARLTRDVVRRYAEEAQSLYLFPALGLDGVHKRVTRWEPMNDRLMYHLIELDSSAD